MVNLLQYFVRHMHDARPQLRVEGSWIWGFGGIWDSGRNGEQLKRHWLLSLYFLNVMGFFWAAGGGGSWLGGWAFVCVCALHARFELLDRELQNPEALNP